MSIDCSYVQGCHSSLDKIAQQQFEYLKSASPGSLAGAGLCAVTSRVTALFMGTIWAVKTIPATSYKTITIAASAYSENRPFLDVVERVGRIWMMEMIQAAGFIAAIATPEMLYALDGKTTFFYHHAHACIESLSDFPVIDEAIYENIGSPIFDPMATLWLDLGLTNRDWKNSIKKTLHKEYRKNPDEMAEYLNPSSSNFTKLFLKTVTDGLCTTIKEKLIDNSLDAQMLKSLNPFTYIMLHAKLSLQEREKLNRLFPGLEESIDDKNLEQEADFYFELITGYKFRSPKCVLFANMLSDCMIHARKKLITDKIYTADDIADYYGDPLQAIATIGIYDLVSGATVDKDVITFTTKDGKKVQLSHDMQLFSMRRELIALHTAIKKLDRKQKEALYEKLTCNEAEVKKRKGYLYSEKDDPLVSDAFSKIVSLNHGVIGQCIMRNDDLRLEDQVNWHAVYAVD